MFLISELPLCIYGLAAPSSHRARSVPVSESDRPANHHDPDPNRHQRSLVSAIANGEKAALGALYDELGGPLYSVAFRMLGDAGEAQDLLQDIFLQVWRTAGSYEKSRGTVFSWLITLTRNRAIDRLRMRRRRAELLADAAPQLHASDTEPLDSRAALWISERAEAVRKALTALTPDQRQAIELAFFGGLTQQEIAQRLNEPLGTVKARIRRGLMQLKEELPFAP